jgi:hypothetical protein
MNKILIKFQNRHFLWLVGVICFLTYHIPVAYFTTYTDYVPEWTLPIFVFSTMIPIWVHEFLWRTSGFASDSYIVFHDIHFEDKKWFKLPCNPFYFFRKYLSWLFFRPMFWIMTSLLISSLIYGYIVPYIENELHPFTPFYIINSIWWLGIIKDFVVFKNDAKEGLITYRLPRD